MRLKVIKVCMYLSAVGFVACWLLNLSTYLGLHPMDGCLPIVIPLFLGIFLIGVVDMFSNYETPRQLDLSVLSNRVQRITKIAIAAALINLIVSFISISGTKEAKGITPFGDDGFVRFFTSIQIFLYLGMFLRAAIGQTNLRRKKKGQW